MKCIALAVASVLLVSSSALAQQGYTPVVQDRNLDCSAFLLGPNDLVKAADFDSAPDFDPYDAGVLAEGGELDGLVVPAANQASEFATAGISCVSDTEADLDIFDPSTTEGSAYGESTFEVVFTLDEEAEYVLTGNLTASSFSTGGVVLDELGESPLAAVFDFTAADGDDVLLDSTGVLAAGAYRLTITLFSEGIDETARATASVDAFLGLSSPSIPTESVTWTDVKNTFGE